MSVAEAAAASAEFERLESESIRAQPRLAEAKASLRAMVKQEPSLVPVMLHPAPRTFVPDPGLSVAEAAAASAEFERLEAESISEQPRLAEAKASLRAMVKAEGEGAGGRPGRGETATRHTKENEVGRGEEGRGEKERRNPYTIHILLHICHCSMYHQLLSPIVYPSSLFLLSHFLSRSPNHPISTCIPRLSSLP